jgi:hypothetical protein
MRRILAPVGLFVFSVLTLASSAVRADVLPAGTWPPSMRWYYDPTYYIAKPTDVVEIHANLRNSEGRTVTIASAYVTSWPAGSSVNHLTEYDLTFGPTANSADFTAQFANRTLAAGEELSFVYGRLTPNGTAPPLSEDHDYTDGNTAYLYLSYVGDSSGPYAVGLPGPTADHYTIHVPEPSSLILLGTGVVALAFGLVKRFRKGAKA